MLTETRKCPLGRNIEHASATHLCALRRHGLAYRCIRPPAPRISFMHVRNVAVKMFGTSVGTLCKGGHDLLSKVEYKHAAKNRQPKAERLGNVVVLCRRGQCMTDHVGQHV